MAEDSETEAVPAPSSLDRSEKPGRVGLLLVLAGLLVGACVGLTFVANDQAQPLILALLALLAMAGVFFLFTLAIGPRLTLPSLSTLPRLRPTSKNTPGTS